MCGICGIAHKTRSHHVPSSLVESMCQTIIHRGPDDQGVHVENNITPEEAQRTKDFYNWIKEEWDETGDNIFLWDFYSYETEGELYLRDEYASGNTDSHPNVELAESIAPLFAQHMDSVDFGKNNGC